MVMRMCPQHAQDLQNTLQTRFSYEDLSWPYLGMDVERFWRHSENAQPRRQSFPRRSRWNPNLYLLTDETLKNPAEFKASKIMRQCHYGGSVGDLSAIVA